MATESSWDVQAAVYSQLTTASALTAQLANGANSILDHVPAGTAFPYVVIGDMATGPMDTQRYGGYDIDLSIHIYSRASGMKEVKSIMAAIFDALHDQTFSVPNQILILCQQTSAQAALESDGITRRGLQNFNIITEPV